jgi:hypothetical protein
MRLRRTLPTLLAVACAPRVAWGQEIQVTGPLAGACPAIAVRYVTPARAQWSYWLSGGVAATHVPAGALTRAEGGVGADITGRALDWKGSERRRGGPHVVADLRAGVWAGAATRAPGALVEGRGVLHLGVLNISSLDLRAGGGYGAFQTGASRTWRRRWHSACASLQPASPWAASATLRWSRSGPPRPPRFGSPRPCAAPRLGRLGGDGRP